MDAVSEIKAKLNIEDVIGEYVQLKRAGRNYKGLSPFGNEKTPSFMVSPEKQIWHDFSTGKGGNVFSFIMEVEGLDFRQALEMLARKAGVDLDQFKGSTPREGSKNRDQAFKALDLAATFYQKQLPVNQLAVDYVVKKRKFGRQTIIDWRLGYSPNTGRALSEFLTRKGFAVDEMKRAGLATERRHGVGDMFRGRLMIPLCDAQGKVVGFTARLLDEQPDAPKYINTPQSITYDKGRNVFGLHLAKESIRKTGFVVVAEGNLDVISSHQAGIKNVVASAGTAMTEMHLKELKRFTSDIRLSFDADDAGLAATERTIAVAQKVEVDLKIVSITGAKDPDELINKDPKLWEQAINSAQYAVDWLIEQYASKLDISSAEGKRDFTDVVLATVRRLRDPVERDHYIKKLAEMTDTSIPAMQAKLEKSPTAPQLKIKPIKAQPVVLDEETREYQRLQDHLLAMTLMQPSLRSLIKNLDAEYFNEGQSRQLFNFLLENPDFDGDPRQAKMLQDISDYVKILSLQFEELYQELGIEDLQQQAARLRTRMVNRYIKTKKQKLVLAMQATDDQDMLAKLMQQVNELNHQIKNN